jgi:hypothetical protein
MLTAAASFRTVLRVLYETFGGTATEMFVCLRNCSLRQVRRQWSLPCLQVCANTLIDSAAFNH